MDVPAIATDGLTKRFGNVTALDNLTLTVPRGEVFGFLGPNGAGKTTTLRLLLGMIRPTTGSAKILGTDVADVKSIHGRVASVPSDVSLWPRLTGEECLELLGRLHGDSDREYRDRLVEQFDLDIARRTRAYSKGNRQKVALVAAFATRAEVLLLDEPTSGLDPLMEREFRSCVREAVTRGQTIFLSSHILSEVQDLCSTVGILREGKLIEVADVDKLRALHGFELELDFEGAPPDLSAVAGVAKVSSTPAGVRLELTGPPGPVLAAIAGARVTGIRSREASLEEIFLAYYGGGGGTKGAS